MILVYCIIHHFLFLDVKPTNVLANREGEVKLCDFGVSGQLIQSRAKTNVGCQSYMAVWLFFKHKYKLFYFLYWYCQYILQPERIDGDTSTYTVQSDVWSLGLSMLEIGTGKYPYPVPNKNVAVFAQLSAIVQGDPPSLPEEEFSAECRDFVAQW